MTRFGVMKHLRVLEEANLVVTRRDGRFKYHYLNALPLQEVADRWMAPYGKPLARFALNMKNALETHRRWPTNPISFSRPTSAPRPSALWDALTNPEMTAPILLRRARAARPTRRRRFDYLDPKGEINLDGEVLELDPPRKLVTTFKASSAEPARR